MKGVRLFPILLMCVLAVAVAVAHQVRDVPAQQKTGTSAIAGVVYAGATGEVPVRRARVMLGSADGTVEARTATTDDEGRFRFSGLPAGRFTLNVSQPGFLSASFGAPRPDRAGTPVPIEEGREVAGLVIRLARGAAISGVVRDVRGRPAPGVAVSALRFSYSWLGDRSLFNSISGSGFTDDRGAYRLWGLPAGEYVVIARSPLGTLDYPSHESFERPDIRAGGSQAGYAPVFYPGVANPQQAAVISIGDAEDRVGIDMSLMLVSVAAVSGVLRLPNGRPPARTSVRILAVGGLDDMSYWFRPKYAQSDADGRFTFTDLPPARYSILVREDASSALATRVGEVAPPPMWASATVDVNGADQQLQLSLQPAMTVAGRIVFDGTTIPLPDPTVLRLRLNTPRDGGLSEGPRGGDVRADGTFAFTGVAPDQYRIIETMHGSWSGTWVTKSLTANGRDVFDSPLAVSPGENVELIVTYSDRPSDLTGTFQDASGRPAPDYFVVAFPVERRLWTSIRRFSHTRPATDGRYSLRLPPGDYLVAALTDFQESDRYSPKFLEELSKAAARVTVRDGETTTQDLKIGK